MVFEDGPLEVLDGVELAIGLGALHDLGGDRVALAREATIALPIVEEEAVNVLSGLGEVARAVLLLRDSGWGKEGQDERAQEGKDSEKKGCRALLHADRFYHRPSDSSKF